MRKEYLLLLPIDTFSVGQTFRRNNGLPLHCTLMPWFTFKGIETFIDFHRELRSLCATECEKGASSSLACLELISESRALFGPDRNIPVHELRRTSRLIALHLKVLEMLTSLNAFPAQPAYVGEGWRPHVTSARRAFPPGKRHRAASLVAVRREQEGGMIVLSTYPLPCAPVHE